VSAHHSISIPAASSQLVAFFVNSDWLYGIMNIRSCQVRSERPPHMGFVIRLNPICGGRHTTHLHHCIICLNYPLLYPHTC